MTQDTRPSRRPHVILAAAVVLLLGASLAARLASTSVTAAGRDLAPHPFRVSELKIPHWSHNDAKAWPVRFRTDLDLLAPLGAGPLDAGEWYVDFRKPDGPRLAEAEAAMARREDREDGYGPVLPADDPLLLEAEPWSDQATMHFYPDRLKPNGWNTQVPNLLVPLMFARSWVARGVASADVEAGLEDCRRAIRLGRLLRQEDIVIINDLVGLACIRLGAQGIYDIAIREGEMELALLASIVIGEVAPQRLLTSERVTRSWDAASVREDPAGRMVLDISEDELESTMAMARGGVDRRFRAEAILALNVVRFMGTDDQRERVVELLTELRALEDPMLSETARWSLEVEPAREQLEGLK